MSRLVGIGIQLWSHVAPRVAAKWLLDKFMTPRPWRHSSTEPDGERYDLADGGVLWRVGAGKKSVLFVHGWSGHRDQFEPVIAALREQDCAVYLLDPPGHGASASQRSNPVRFIRAVEEAFSLAGKLDLAAGHSMGGSALLHASLSNPELAPRQLVSISAPADFDYPIRSAARLARFGRTATERFVAMVEHEVGKPRDELKLLPKAKGTKLRLHVIHDKDDPQIPLSHAHSLTENWPDAALLETAGHGHNRVLRSAELVAMIDRLTALGVR
ncbi:alpha/beta fold hydrolase [uncultured Erythrobacter sp.]|uniref:alpha/beta hydrolase n=1 Tax=uncultured Erythrobacter sp. TaxID=263913 RepID=UPI00261B3B90|nr:alpha/beta fold hydrolase [uncultured Erythrobacter sp.]